MTSEEITIINASRSGIRVTVPTRLKVGSVVQVTFDKSIIIAEVRNCRAEGDALSAGLFISVFYDRNDPTVNTNGDRVRDIVRHRGADTPN
jgi:hypothetical protein